MEMNGNNHPMPLILEVLNKFRLNKDSTKLFSFTEFPLVLPTKKPLRVRMVSVEIHSKSEEKEYIKLPPRSLIPPSTISSEWQLNLSSADSIRQTKIPSEGIIKVSIQHKNYIGNYSIEDKRDCMEGYTIPIPIAEENTGLQHELFSHLKIILDKETMLIIKMCMVQDPEEISDVFRTKRARSDVDVHISESLSKTSISPKSKRKKL